MKLEVAECKRDQLRSHNLNENHLTCKEASPTHKDGTHVKSAKLCAVKFTAMRINFDFIIVVNIPFHGRQGIG